MRAGFTEAEVDAVVRAKGRIPMVKALRYQLRYLSEGIVLGSRRFVEAFFDKNRKRFGPRRKTGARAVRGIDAGDRYTARDFRKGFLAHEVREGG